MTAKPPRRQVDPLCVGIVRLPHGRGLDLPAYQSDGAAGMDLCAAVAEGHPVRLAPGARAPHTHRPVLELPAGLGGRRCGHARDWR